jgi:hypothetical protein
MLKQMVGTKLDTAKLMAQPAQQLQEPFLRAGNGGLRDAG